MRTEARQPPPPILHCLLEFAQTHVIESLVLSNHLIICHSLSLIRVFSYESALRNRWPRYWSFSFCISLSNEPPSWITALSW